MRIIGWFYFVAGARTGFSCRVFGRNEYAFLNGRAYSPVDAARLVLQTKSPRERDALAGFV